MTDKNASIVFCLLLLVFAVYMYVGKRKFMRESALVDAVITKTFKTSDSDGARLERAKAKFEFNGEEHEITIDVPDSYHITSMVKLRVNPNDLRQIYADNWIKVYGLEIVCAVIGLGGIVATLF